MNSFCSPIGQFVKINYVSLVRFSYAALYTRFIPTLHDRANIEQTSSRCIQNTRANCSTSARRLLDVC